MVLHAMAEETSLAHAYQTFQSQALRDSLHIPWKIWSLLSKEIKDEVLKIKDKLKAEKTEHMPKNDSPRLSKPKDKKIPPQYGLSRNVNNVSQDDTAACLSSLLESYHIDDDDKTLSDDEMDEDERMGGMVTTTPSIDVHAHLEY